MSFKDRSYQKEYLDNDHIKASDLYRNLSELHIINRALGGYSASRKGLAKLFEHGGQVCNILDVGFGGGDFIREMSSFGKKKNKPLFFYGVDLKKDCMAYAEQNLRGISNKQLICDDYRNVSAEWLKKIDVIHCSLFLHHLTDEEITALFRYAKENNCAILANDLHRNWLACYSIKLLTVLFSRSYLVKNDAPLSVRRGFKRAELEGLLNKAGYKDYEVKWSWAFRYIVIARP